MRTKAISAIRDFVISLIISILTTSSLNISNIIYQTIIFILGVVIVFLILSMISKVSKNLEILSILYCESILIRFLDFLNQDIDVIFDEKKQENPELKLFVILPDTFDDLKIIKDSNAKLKRIEIKLKAINRTFFFYGKQLGDRRIVIFDTPILWAMGVDFYRIEKRLKRRKVNSLIKNMNEDIINYSNKKFSGHSEFKKFRFIKFDEFKTFYE